MFCFSTQVVSALGGDLLRNRYIVARARFRARVPPLTIASVCSNPAELARCWFFFLFFVASRLRRDAACPAARRVAAPKGPRRRAAGSGAFCPRFRS